MAGEKNDPNAKPPVATAGGGGFDTFKLLFDSEYRGQAIGLLLERGLPIIGGTALIFIGVSFVLAGSKAGQAAVTVVETLATKGKNLVGTGADAAKEVIT